MLIFYSFKLVIFIIIILKNTNSEKPTTSVLNLGSRLEGKKRPSSFIFDVFLLNKLKYQICLL